MQAEGCITIRDAARELSRSFRDAGLSSPSLDARVLIAHACGLTAEDLIRAADRCVDGRERDRILVLKERRLRREPVSRIIERREFFGLPFQVTPAVLDPRPETELLVETALTHVKAFEGSRTIRVLDLGTGSGCIIASLLVALPQATGVAVDVSEAALKTAKASFEALGVWGRVSPVCGRWDDCLGDRAYDVIVSNPPYIQSHEIVGLDTDVAAFDPKLALDGGPDGLACIRDVMSAFSRLLAGDGLALCEIGSRQGDAARTIAEAHGLNAHVLKDFGGMDRAVACMRQSAR
jgi:release factor glutamine methyltransferase